MKKAKVVTNKWFGFNHNGRILGAYATKVEANKDCRDYTKETENEHTIVSRSKLDEDQLKEVENFLKSKIKKVKKNIEKINVSLSSNEIVQVIVPKVRMTDEQRKEAKRLANLKCMSKDPQRYGAKTIKTNGLYELLNGMKSTKEVKDIIAYIEYETNNALKEYDKLMLNS